MAEEPNQIKRHIDATRDELGKNMDELEQRVRKAADWRTYFDKSPMTAIALAFAGGVALSGFVGRQRSSANGRQRHALSQAGEGLSRSAVDFRRSEAADMFDNVKGAIIAWGASQFKTMLNQWLPGFRQQYERTEAQKNSHAHERGPLA
jgi:hypothetical protein